MDPVYLAQFQVIYRAIKRESLLGNVLPQIKPMIRVRVLSQETDEII